MKDGFVVENFARLKNQPRSSHFMTGIHGQSVGRGLEWPKSFPFMLLSPCKVVLCCFALFLLASASLAQTNFYAPNGSEYAVVGNLSGDQVYPDVALNATGGFVVWQDNATDGSGWGISARRLDGTFSGELSTFRVNFAGSDDQENARVAMLPDGGAAFVWQGGKEGLDQHIYARFLSPSNTWLTGDILVNSLVTNTFFIFSTNYTTTVKKIWNARHTKIKGYATNVTATVMTNKITSPSTLQVNPAVAVLANGNAVVVWSSFNQVASDSMQDIYGQILAPDGSRIGSNFLVNQFTSFNQRSPVIAPLKNGGFVVAWVSEQQRTAINSGGIDEMNGATNTLINLPSVDVYARLYNSSGIASGDEFLVSTDSMPHANPSVAVGSDGGFVVTWTGKDTVTTDNSWDIYARSFSAGGVGGATAKVNSHVFGDQYLSRVNAVGTDYLIVWTSLGQDGSREGVYGQFLHGNGSLVGNEFRINGTTVSQQMQPALASDGIGQFLAVWTSYTGSPYSFELFAQRYVNAGAILQAMSAPFIHVPFVISNNVYQPQLVVSWPEVQGISISNYEVYVDGASAPSAIVANNQWTMTSADGLAASSTHSFTLDYVTTDGRRSPLSPPASGTTWNGCNWFNVPCEWMTLYYGNNLADWPAADGDTDSDGMDTLQEFQAGTIPTNSASALMVQLNQTDQGMFVSWNTQPGLTYQVQVSTNLVDWSNYGSPRFAADTSDSVNVGSGANSYYHVILVR